MTTLPELLKLRIKLVREIRAFFEQRDVLEATTPLLSQAAVTDPAIESFSVHVDEDQTRYLRTSPEFPLKRLLGAGAPDVFELGPVFRNGEIGRRHNPEFMLLEWYRLGFSMQQLINEVIELLKTVGNGVFSHCAVRQVRYYELFEQALGCDVREMEHGELADLARAHSAVPDGPMDVDQWLDFLFGTSVQSVLSSEEIVVVTHYPASQAALARIDPDSPDTALRFEVFVNGVELANGFEELNDPVEQAARFSVDNRIRTGRGQNPVPVDQRFLAALEQLPDCSGVALGFDRLLMLVHDLPSIHDAIAIPWNDA